MHSSPTPSAASDQREIRLRVNGQLVQARIPVHLSLAELLRGPLGLPGTKIACNQAACGACTVHLDGQPILACHTLAVQVPGADVRSIEGLARGEQLHPLQQAFIDHDALQCGFCTPGMLMALVAVIDAAIDAGTAPDRTALAQAISGNVCRCGAYQQILDAALAVLAR